MANGLLTESGAQHLALDKPWSGDFWSASQDQAASLNVGYMEPLRATRVRKGSIFICWNSRMT
jgi:hypothetical protein